MRATMVVTTGLLVPLSCVTPSHVDSCLGLQADDSTVEGVDVEGTLALYAPALEHCGTSSAATRANNEPLLIDLLLNGRQPVSVQVVAPAKGELHDCVARSVDRWRFDPAARGRLIIEGDGWVNCR